MEISYETLKSLIQENEEQEREIKELKNKLVQEKARADRFMLEVLDSSYEDYGISHGCEKEKRIEVGSPYFGLIGIDNLFKMGITYEQMIDYIERKDKEGIEGVEENVRF